MDRVLTLTINGVKRTIYYEGNETLLEILREKLNLTGTKFGCGYGVCGACTVVVNGEAVNSCKTAFRNLEGAEVLTIEGLAKDGKLHPIQQAFIDANAVQCGFCTPGIIMRLYALFTNNPDASEDDIMEALSHHLCRCTGYESIITAAKLARDRLMEGAKLAQQYMKK